MHTNLMKSFPKSRCNTKHMQASQAFRSNQTLTSLYQPLVFFQHLSNGYSVLFSGARCRNILQQPPESHAVLLCFCVSLVDHWKLAILNKVSDSFWLFSANKIFVWGDKSLFRLAFRSKYFAAYVANPPCFCVY